MKLFLNMDRAHDVRVASLFRAGKPSAAGSAEQLIGGNVFKPFVVLCGQSFIALGKIFSLSPPVLSFHHYTL